MIQSELAAPESLSGRKSPDRGRSPSPLEEQSQQPLAYELDEQIGYLLRLANQRHLEIFSEHMPSLTPTQFSVLARLYEVGELSQNELGRQVGIDAATTNGVIERLLRKELIHTKADTKDKRRLCISLTPQGLESIEHAIKKAQLITHKTVENLTAAETARLLVLLKKLQKT